MQSDTPEGFYQDIQYKDSSFRLRIERELVEDDLGVEKVDRSAFEDWFGRNLFRVCEAAYSKHNKTAPTVSGEKLIVLLNRGDLDGF